MHAVMYLLLVYIFIILNYELYIYDHDVKGVISHAASLLIKLSVHIFLAKRVDLSGGWLLLD